MSTPIPGGLYCYSDNGNPGNVNISNFVMVSNSRWNEFWYLFAGVNSLGQNRIYAVNQGGQLLSYSATEPLSNEVIVGADAWGHDNFTSVFAGMNSLGENRIYAVSGEGFLGLSGGQLLSYSDNGKPGNVGHPVIVGADGWDNMNAVFAGRDSAGRGRIYAWNGSQLLSYSDNGTKGNVGHPIIVSEGALFDWPEMHLFAGVNSLGQNRTYAAPLNGQLQSFSDNGTHGNILNPVIVGDSGWFGFGALFAGANSAGQNRIYGVYGPTLYSQFFS